MGVWGAHAVRARRRWVLGAHAPCRSDEHGRLWCIFGVTLARNAVCGASDVPQPRVFVAYGPYWRDMARHMRHKRKSSSAAPSACATNASLRQPLLLHAPQTQVFASCARRMCHKWNFPSVLLLRVPRTKLPVASLCHQPGTCVIAVLYAPHISKWALHLQPSTPKNLAGGGGRRHHPVRQIHREEMSS